MKDIPSEIVIPCRVAIGNDSVVVNFTHNGTSLRNSETIEIPVTQDGEYRALTITFLSKKYNAELTRISRVVKGDIAFFPPGEIVIYFY